MPGEPREIACLAVELQETPHSHIWMDRTAITEEEIREVDLVREYHWRMALAVANRAIQNPAQKKAMRLLCSLLSHRQRSELRRLKYFYLFPQGGDASRSAYRITPSRGFTEQVTKHGTRWFTTASYCLHDDRTDIAETMPPADLSIAHMLMILADEDEFLRLANITHTRNQLWNRDYLRMLRNRPAAGI